MKILKWFFLFFAFPGILMATELTQFVQAKLTTADSLKLAYDYRPALKLLDSVWQVASPKLATNDTLLAALYYQQAEALYYVKEHKPALAKAELAITIQQASYSTKHAKTAKTAYLIGLLYQRLKQQLKAKTAIQKAIDLTPTTDFNGYYRHRRLGYLYADAKMDSLAILHFQKALKGFAPTSLESIRISYWLATSLGKVGQKKQAKKYFETTKSICRTQRKQFPTERRYLVALQATLIREAAFYAAIGATKKAIQLYEKIVLVKDELSLKEKDLLWNYTVQKTELYFDYTKVFRKEGDIIIDYKFSSSETDVAGCVCNEGVASIYENIGQLYGELANYNQAFAHFQKAIKVLIPDFSPTNFYDIPTVTAQPIRDKQLLVRLLFSFAKVTQQKYTTKQVITDLEQTIQIYQTIDTLTTLTRQQIKVANSRYKIIEETKAIFENAIQVSLNLFEKTQVTAYLEMAYQFSAKNKAIVLLDGLQNEQARLAAGIPPEILAKESKLRRAYNNLEVAILKTENETQKAELSEKLFITKSEYNRFINQLEKEYPAYYELKYAFSKPLKVAAIQENLPDSTLLLEYFLGEEQLFVFSIHPSGIQYNRISLPSDFRAICTEYLALLDSGTDMPKVRYAELAYQLYQAVLATPLATINQPASRLIIIPDDVLIPLSFATFLTKPITNWQGRKNPYLLYDYAISYAYANQLLFDKAASQRVDLALKEFGGFGIEYHEPSAFAQQKDTTTNLIFNRSIGTLPNSDEEVLGIYQFINGFSWIPLRLIKSIPFLRNSIWINEEATKESFVEHAEDYKILHLAMHGLLANDNPLNSALLFSPSTSKTDNTLKAAELYSMRLNAEMVVLGACDTGRGKINKGEGIRSLARVFTYIGCPSLVASLWKASDDATKKIMLPFYENLVQKQPKDIALQNAQIQYLKVEHPEFSTPPFWGHLALIGDAQSIEIVKPKLYWLYVLLLILSIFIVTKGIRQSRLSVHG